MNVISIVQSGSVYKYVPSSSTIFQSSCGIMRVVKNHNLLDLLLNLLVNASQLLDLLLIMLMKNYCLFCSHLDFERNKVHSMFKGNHRDSNQQSTQYSQHCIVAQLKLVNKSLCRTDSKNSNHSESL